MEDDQLYGKGAAKYAANNWMLGYSRSSPTTPCKRHAMEWWGGNEFDDGEGGTGQERLDGGDLPRAGAAAAGGAA